LSSDCLKMCLKIIIDLRSAKIILRFSQVYFRKWSEQFLNFTISFVIVYILRHRFCGLKFLSLRRREAPAEAICFRVVRPCVRPCVSASVRPSVRDSRDSFMFPRYLQYLLTDFRQTFVTGVSRDRDDLITFLGQKVKVQGHAIAAEAYSTLRYRRVQLFLVLNFYLVEMLS